MFSGCGIVLRVECLGLEFRDLGLARESALNIIQMSIGIEKLHTAPGCPYLTRIEGGL